MVQAVSWVCSQNMPVSPTSQTSLVNHLQATTVVGRITRPDSLPNRIYLDPDSNIYGEPLR